jgi:hypothetical protein
MTEEAGTLTNKKARRWSGLEENQDCQKIRSR